jgi:two-component system response regulator HydG
LSEVLLIVQEEPMRQLFREILGSEGLQVTTTVDPASARSLLASRDFDLILADIALMGSSKMELLSEIRQNGLTAPVVMIAGQPSLETASQAMRLGAFDYVAKPVGRQALLKAVRQALLHKALLEEKSRLQAESQRYYSHMEAIFRSVTEGIVAVDTSLRVSQANQAAEAICGFSREDAIGRGWAEIETDCSKDCRKVLALASEGRVPVRHQRLTCWQDGGRQQLVIANATPLKDQAGHHLGAVLVLRDISRLAQLERELEERRGYHRLVGASPAMQRVYSLLEDLADTDATALITGESGTGKELVAEALHYSGPRREKPLVKVNCSALAENLLESELFGHVRGAFTGAVRDKAGRFELAHGGSLMLDEVGDISPRIQLKLLRALQEKEFERVGETRTRKVDVRIIACTNQDLKAKVGRGEFREDLYYRLHVVEVSLPPLRERSGDISLLARHFLAKFRLQYNKNIQSLSPGAMEILLNHAWPGNVRELEHALEHAVVLCRGNVLESRHLPRELRPAVGGRLRAGEADPSSQSEELRLALERCRWNKARTARELGISRQTLYRRLKRHSLA